jgi:murein DD-endopeptidase MepM/ murein hydrolase activator NlpD
MRIRRALVAIVLSMAFVPNAGLSKSHVDDKIQQQRAKIHAVHEKLNQKRGELDSARSRVQSLQSQLDTTNHNIAAVNGHLAELQGRIRSTQRKLAWNQIQLRGAQTTLKRHQDVLNRRLVDAYEHGDLGYLDVLLRARSFGDFVERWNDIRFLVKTNEATIRSRKGDEARVVAIQNGLLGTQSELTSEQNQAQQQQRALDSLAAQRKDLVAQADGQRREVQTQVSQLDDISAAEEAALEALVAEKQREEEARRLADRRARQLAGEDLPPEPGAPGELMWPVSGPITDRFGMRYHPVYHRMIPHNGIDIGVPTGTPVAAAGSGTIIVASYQGDCGNMIAIDHHGGLSTVYCHLSHIFVAVGQTVQRGQTIGAAGATGDATGPHVHFGVLQNGHPVDPMSYLR